MYVCMYVCAYISLSLYIYIYTYTYMYIYTHWLITKLTYESTSSLFQARPERKAWLQQPYSICTYKPALNETWLQQP